MATANIEIYVDEPSNDEPIKFTKTPLKTPLKMNCNRIPLTPAKRNFATTPGRGKLLNVQGNHPKFLDSARKSTKQDQNVLPEIETSSRLAAGLANQIFEIDLDELLAPRREVLDSDDEQEIEFLSWNPIERATRKQQSIGKEISECSLGYLERPCCDEFDEDSFVFTLDPL